MFSGCFSYDSPSLSWEPCTISPVSVSPESAAKAGLALTCRNLWGPHQTHGSPGSQTNTPSPICTRTKQLPVSFFLFFHLCFLCSRRGSQCTLACYCDLPCRYGHHRLLFWRVGQEGVEWGSNLGPRACQVTVLPQSCAPRLITSF